MRAVRCQRCAIRACLCEEIPAIANRIPVVILRHVLERHKRTNSARWAALALTRCRIVDYGGRDDSLDSPSLLGRGAWLVYPGRGAGAAPTGTPETLLFLDGSWAQTRRMLHRIPGLASLPRLALPPGHERRRLRRPPDGGLATLEAVAAALALHGERDAAARLDALYALAVERSFEAPRPRAEPLARNTIG